MNLSDLFVGKAVKIKNVDTLLSEGWVLTQQYGDDVLTLPGVPEYHGVPDAVHKASTKRSIIIDEVSSWGDYAFTTEGSYHHFHISMIEEPFDIKSIYKEF